MTNLLDISLDVMWIIFKKCSFIDQIHLRQVCRVLYEKLYIYDFYNIDYKYSVKLSDKILDAYKKNIRYLDASYNAKITTLIGFPNLVKLDARGGCGLGQKEIEGLKLKKINVSFNSKINDLSQMLTLEELTAWGSDGIGQKGIEGLRLKLLDITMNSQIIDVTSIITLEVLVVSGSCNIGQKGIEGLKLKKIYGWDNAK